MHVTCPYCSTPYELPDHLMGPGGARVRCRTCREQFVVPPGGEPVPLRVREPGDLPVTPDVATPATGTAESGEVVEHADEAMLAALRRGEDERPGLDGAGTQQGLPVPLALRWPVGDHDEHIHPLQGGLPECLRKSQVIADEWRHAHHTADARVDLHHQRTFARLILIRLAAKERYQAARAKLGGGR